MTPSSKLNWSKQEEEMLKQYVEKQTKLTWNEIAQAMNTSFPGRNRSGKQYRERYVNYIKFLDDSHQKNDWNEEEQKTLFGIYRKIGTKWTQIGKFIPSKSENSLKNRFYGTLRKVIRKLNRVGKQSIKKFNKPIRYDSLIRIMDAAEGGQDLPLQIQLSSKSIKEEILNLAENCYKEFDQAKVTDLIKEIYSFNIATRCYSSKKWKKPLHSANVKQEQKEDGDEDQQNLGQQQYPDRLSTHQLQQGWQKLNENSQFKIEGQSNCLGSSEECRNSHGATETSKAKYQQDFAQLGLLKFSTSTKDDLDYQLCEILKQNYQPQSFYYFQG